MNEKESKIIPIDRSKPFNPIEFIGEGWTVIEEDERSLALTQVDLTSVRFEICLKKGEIRIKGEEKLKRLKKMDCIRLDAKIFQTLWENKHLIPEAWKEKINDRARYIFFDGTVFRGPNGDRYVLCLRYSNNKWFRSYYWFGYNWLIYSLSAVLESS